MVLLAPVGPRTPALPSRTEIDFRSLLAPQAQAPISTTVRVIPVIRDAIRPARKRSNVREGSTGGVALTSKLARQLALMVWPATSPAGVAADPMAGRLAGHALVLLVTPAFRSM